MKKRQLIIGGEKFWKKVTPSVEDGPASQPPRRFNGVKGAQLLLQRYEADRTKARLTGVTIAEPHGFKRAQLVVRRNHVASEVESWMYSRRPRPLLSPIRNETEVEIERQWYRFCRPYVYAIRQAETHREVDDRYTAAMKWLNAAAKAIAMWQRTEYRGLSYQPINVHRAAAEQIEKEKQERVMQLKRQMQEVENQERERAEKERVARDKQRNEVLAALHDKRVGLTFRQLAAVLGVSGQHLKSLLTELISDYRVVPLERDKHTTVYVYVPEPDDSDLYKVGETAPHKS